MKASENTFESQESGTRQWIPDVTENIQTLKHIISHTASSKTFQNEAASSNEWMSKRKPYI